MSLASIPPTQVSKISPNISVNNIFFIFRYNLVFFKKRKQRVFIAVIRPVSNGNVIKKVIFRS